jgi:hypothetical protein
MPPPQEGLKRSRIFRSTSACCWQRTAYVGSAGVPISVPVAKTISRRVEDAGLLDSCQAADVGKNYIFIPGSWVNKQFQKQWVEQ